MSILGLHLRYGLRKLLREPVLTGMIVLVLGLGIGANTLMFMVLDRLVLRPVPFANLEQLVTVWETAPLQGVTRGSVSPSNFLDWQERARSFEAITAMRRIPLRVRTQEGTSQVQGAWVTENFFKLFPARVALGRTFRGEESRDFIGTIVISHGLWQKLFSSDPGIVGRAIEVDGELLTVLGVLRAGEEFPRGADAWIPVRLEHGPDSRGTRSLLVIADLKPGTALEQAQAEMDGIALSLREDFPEANAQAGVMVAPLRDELVANYRSVVWLMFSGLVLILLVVCINVTNMLLVRAAARRKEFAISMALGANRGEMLRQLGIEVLLVVLAGAGLGLAFASAGLVLLRATILGQLVQAENLSLDLRILTFTLGVVLIAGLMMALVPAAQFLGIGLNVFNDEGGEWRRGGGRRVLSLQRVLVVLQLAISLPLLVAAALLFQNLRRIGDLDLGFNSEDVLTWRLSFSQQDTDPGQRTQIVATGLARIDSLPGGLVAGIVSDLPFSGSRTSGGFVIVGRETTPDNAPSSDLRIIAGDYFQALRIPLKRGRAFNESDNRSTPGVAIINESLARVYWPDEDPIGQRIRIGAPEEVALFGGSIEREIVGIVGDVVHEGLGGGRRPEVYLPYGQNPSATLTLTVRAGHDSLAILADIPNSFLEGGKHIVMSNVRPMGEIVSRSLGFPGVQTGAVIFLSMLSLLLVGMSVYAVISYFLAQKRHNLMIRIALGAQSRDVLWLLAQQGLVMCLGGTSVGAIISLALAGLLSRQVHLIQPRAVPAVLLGIILLTALTLITCLAPTRQILGREAGSLLRYE